MQLIISISVPFRYFERYWLNQVTPQSFSVYRQVRRTNNVQESYHRILLQVVGTAHPNCWEFLGKYNCIKEMYKDLRSLQITSFLYRQVTKISDIKLQ